MNHMDMSRESGLGAPPGRPRLHLYLLLTATLLLALLLAGGVFWGNYYRGEPEELALGYHQPAAQLLTRMLEEAQRLNGRLLDDAWSGRTLVWDKKYRTLHYDHLLVIRKRFDSLQSLEKRYARGLAPLPEKARLLRSLEGRLLALEEEWASASVVTALIFNEFATRELPNFANELSQVRRMHEDASQLLLNRLETERAFELQVLMSLAALLLLLALWGVRRGFAHIQYTMTVLEWLEKSLQASRADTALLVKASRFFLWEMDSGGTRFEQVDGGLMTLLGRPAEAWVGVDELAAVMHPDDCEQAILARNAMVAGTSDESHCSYRVVKADGELVWLRDVVMLRSGEGGRGRYRGFFADVTQEQNRLDQLKEQHGRECAQWNDELVQIKKQHALECAQLAGESARLEAERVLLLTESDRIMQELVAIQEDLRNADARLWAIQEYAQVAITLKDLQGCYVFVNRCFQEWFGVADGDLQGCTDDTLFAESLCVESKQRDRAVLEDGIALASEEVWPMGEGMGLFSVVRFPLSSGDGRILGVFAMLVDVTDRKILEEELLGELHLVRTHARQAERTQAQCLAIMGREVPSLVRGMLRMIERLQESGPPVRQQGRLELLAQSAKSLLALVDEMQSGFRLSGSPPAGENFDLLLMLEETAEIFARYALGAGKRLQGRIGHGVPRAVRGDVERLRRLLAVLLGGAVHAVSSGVVLFSVQSHPKDSYRILLQIPVGGVDPSTSDDLVVLERLAGDLGGACRMGSDLIDVIVQLGPPIDTVTASMDDEPHDEST